MSPLCKGEKEAQQVVTSLASHRESQLCERKQQAKSLDVVTSSAFPVTIKGHTVAVQVNGATSSLLVDTGSAISLIRQDLWKKCRREHDKLEPWTQRLVSVDGSPVSVLGCSQMRITIGSDTFHHTVLVVDTLTTEGILELDFLKKYRCSVDLGENMLKISRNSICIPLDHSTDNDATLNQINVTAQTVCVPPKSELEILAKTSVNISEEATWLLEGQQIKESPLVVARALVIPCNNTVVVRLLNPDAKPFTLHEKSNIAVIEPLNSLCVSSTDATANANTNPVVTEEKKCMLWDIVCNCDANLSDVEKESLFFLLLQFGDIFATPQDLPGRTDKLKHFIDTGTAHPIRQPVQRIPPAKRSEVTKLLDEMMQKDVIQPSSSPWASPIVLVQKKDGTTRFCVDYRKLNAVTRKDAYPLPRIDDTLDTLHGSKWFSTLDLASGYWQVELHKDCQDRTAFCTPNGLFEFKVLPFGLCNAPSIFQRLMDLILTGLQWSSCLVYLDDIIILGKNFADHIHNVQLVLHRIKDAGFKLQPTKCHFFRKAVSYLGHIVSEQGVAVDPSKVDKIKLWPIPTSSCEVQQFLGLANYYRLKGFAEMAKPLHKLTERNAIFKWSLECENAFSTLRFKLTTTPVLAYPDFSQQFILDTDANNMAIEAVLSQIGGDGQEHVIAYGSRLLTKSERQYCVMRRELLAVVIGGSRNFGD